MPAKKGRKKKSAKKSMPAAVNAGDIAAALVAISATATTGDRIFDCVALVFDEEGLNHISSEDARIVWADIEDEVIVKLGDGITACLAAKGIDVPALAPAFQNLKNQNKVTVVSDLVASIGKFA